jgi:hypothetical protein
MRITSLEGASQEPVPVRGVYMWRPWRNYKDIYVIQMLEETILSRGGVVNSECESGRSRHKLAVMDFSLLWRVEVDAR